MQGQSASTTASNRSTHDSNRTITAIDVLLKGKGLVVISFTVGALTLVLSTLEFGNGLIFGVGRKDVQKHQIWTHPQLIMRGMGRFVHDLGPMVNEANRVERPINQTPRGVRGGNNAN